MKRYVKQKILSFSVFCAFSAAIPLAAFDWPQKEVLSDSFYSYFGQLRGDTISSSLIFAEPDSVRTADKGRVLAIISEHDNEDGWFESTLGNAVIIAHKDNLLTVYANLDKNDDSDIGGDTGEVSAGTLLGSTGISGWQQGKSCLEFQVLDTKNNTAMNPRVLMPRVGNEQELYISDLTAVNPQGKIYSIPDDGVLPAGKYLLYKRRQKPAVPYKTTVSINGVAVETISYDVLIQSDNRLCVQGRKPYPLELVYPDNKRQLLGDIVLTHGKNLLSVTVSDILGKEKTATYTIVVN